MGGLGVAAMPACTSVREPVMTLNGVELTQRSDSAAVVRFALDAENVNSDALPLRELRYEVLADGRPVFKGVRSPQATLRRYGTQRIVVPAVVPAESAGSGVRYELRGELGYVVPGPIAETLYDWGLSRPHVTFSVADVAK